MITKLSVTNYRTLADFTWHPPDAGVLVGPNGAGKTALVEVLQLLRDLIVDGTPASELGLGQSRTAWLDHHVQVIRLETKLAEETFDYELKLVHGEVVVVAEELRGNGQTLYRNANGKVELFGDAASESPRTEFPFSRTMSFLSVLERRPDNVRISEFRDAVSRWGILQPNPIAMSGVSDRESRTLRQNLRNFASWYRWVALRDLEISAALATRLRSVVPALTGLSFSDRGGDYKELYANFQPPHGARHTVPFSHLSEGQKVLIALYAVAYFVVPAADLIVADEVENFVAPDEIQPWYQFVGESLRDTGGQFLVVSHHPEAINYMAADSAWQMVRDGTGASIIRPIELDIESGVTVYDALTSGSVE